MTHVLVDLEPRTADDGLLRGAYQVIAAVDAEELPQGPPVPYEQRLLRFRATPPAHVSVKHRVAVEGDAVVGYSMTQVWPDEDPDNAYIRIMVPPDRRRQGIGTALMTDIVERLAAEDRGKVIVDCIDGWPIEGWLAKLGLKKSLTEKRSRLLISDLDPGLMDTWIARAAERAADYEVVFLDSPVPDEHLESWARAKTAINDEPSEDLEFERTPMTPAKWREHERYTAERGETLLLCGARHVPSGEFVGSTVMYVQEHLPELAEQGDTAVDSAHRNRGLGRLIKAAMAKRVLAEYPAVTMIDTHNAGSNAAMLGINIEMGFRPIQVIGAWQGETKTILDNLH
jgi:GNAT superfamily N-acetyltransferase